MTRRGILFSSGAFVVSALFLGIACSDAARPEFGTMPSADAAPEASLPPQAAEDASDTAPRDAGAAYDASDEPVACPPSGPCAVQIVAGYSHFCARLRDGSVWCWGDPVALGGEPPPKDGGSADAGVPFGSKPAAMPVSDAAQISASVFTTCARTTAGVVYCWGSNSTAALGTGDNDSESHAPTPVDLDGGTVARVDVGYGAVFARLEAGPLWSWGWNGPALGRPGIPSSSSGGPYFVAPGGPVDERGFVFSEVRMHGNVAIAATPEKKLVSWGGSTFDVGPVLGRETSIAPPAAAAVIPTLTDVTEVAMADNHACAIAGGHVACWGGYVTSHSAPTPAPLCNGDGQINRVPQQAPTLGLAHPQMLALARDRTCVRMTDGTIQCCGKDAYGELGEGVVDHPDGGVIFEPSFVRAKAFDGYAVALATATSTTCAITKTGVVQCWGGNAKGELGVGTRDALAHPVPMTVSFDDKGAP